MAAIHLTSIMFSKEESDTDSGRNCPKQRKPLVCVWREILTRRRRGLEECWRMTQLVRLAPLAPMHVNCRQSFPSRGSHEEWEERRNGASPRLSDGNNGHHSHRSKKVPRNRSPTRLQVWLERCCEIGGELQPFQFKRWNCE